MAFQRARTLFPFPILGIDTDNGGEFLNEEVVAYCEQEQLTFTRGRPYQKRDQCFVEVRRFGACEIASKMQEVENTMTS